MRQDDSEVNADDLHRLLILARLVTLAQGGRQVTTEFWNKARQMEIERRARLTTLHRPSARHHNGFESIL